MAHKITSGFYTPPDMFGPTKQWEDFLAKMKGSPHQDYLDVKTLIKQAQKILKERRSKESRAA
jgi:hypothetical protein